MARNGDFHIQRKRLVILRRLRQRESKGFGNAGVIYPRSAPERVGPWVLKEEHHVPHWLPRYGPQASSSKPA